MRGYNLQFNFVNGTSNPRACEGPGAGVLLEGRRLAARDGSKVRGPRTLQEDGAGQLSPVIPVSRETARSGSMNTASKENQAQSNLSGFGVHASRIASLARRFRDDKRRGRIEHPSGGSQSAPLRRQLRVQGLLNIPLEEWTATSCEPSFEMTCQNAEPSSGRSAATFSRSREKVSLRRFRLHTFRSG
jgi:hypothetical protein